MLKESSTVVYVASGLDVSSITSDDETKVKAAMVAPIEDGKIKGPSVPSVTSLNLKPVRFSRPLNGILFCGIILLTYWPR